MKKILVVLILILCFQQNCSAKDEQTFVTISPKEAYALMEEMGNEILIDVRTESEFKTGYIKDAILIPIQELGNSDVILEPTQPVFLYCAVGGRSYFAGKYLENKGIQKIYNIEGGIKSWQKEGLPIESN